MDPIAAAGVVGLFLPGGVLVSFVVAGSLAASVWGLAMAERFVFAETLLLPRMAGVFGASSGTLPFVLTLFIAAFPAGLVAVGLRAARQTLSLRRSVP